MDGPLLYLMISKFSERSNMTSFPEKKVQKALLEKDYAFYCIFSIHDQSHFLTFPECFSIPIIFSNLNSNISDLLDLRNLKEQVKKTFCYQTLFWSFTVWINCCSDLKIFANSRPSASNFKSFSRSIEQFFLTVGQLPPCNTT